MEKVLNNWTIKWKLNKNYLNDEANFYVFQNKISKIVKKSTKILRIATKKAFYPQKASVFGVPKVFSFSKVLVLSFL